MKSTRWMTVVAAALLHWTAACSASAAAGPYVDGRFRGRIAYSCDGNHNDRDDWIASPVTLAILAEAGLKERLVHFDYNSILPRTDPEWEKTHAESVLGTAERYGFDRTLFFDCRKDLDGALDSIARAVDRSTAEDPLYLIIAGPVEVPYLGIRKSDPAKRQFVYCISHSRWNDGFASKYKFTFTKRSVIEQDVHWVQIRDQNRLLSCGRYGRPSPPEEFEPHIWMRDSGDATVRWLWERMVVSTRPDPSDAGMTYFLATGDEECDPAKLKRLIEDHQPPAPTTARKTVRIEAENFRHLEGCSLEDRNDKLASQGLNTRLSGASTGRIRTRFDEPFTPDAARYDVEIRYLDAKISRCRFELLVNGIAQGAGWESPGKGRGWTSQTVRNVAIGRGDEIMVEVRGNGGEAGRLDYVQLSYRSESSGESSSEKTRAATTAGTLFVFCPIALAYEVLAGAEPPYPPSDAIESLTWHWETHRTAAPGSDLWPVTWGPNGHLYTAWGDGGGFGGTNSDGRVSMGFARIEGPPESFRGVNINGGKNPEHPASFPKRGNFKPIRFLNFGRDNADVPDHLAGYVYFYVFREDAAGEGQDVFLGRAPRTSLRDPDAYEFFRGTTDGGKPIWTKDVARARPVFTDRNGLVLGGIAYHPVLKRYLLASYHTGPGQLGVFDGPQPWGPWTTVAYYERWGDMGTDGQGLNCDFPQKWISRDGRTMWCVFSVYGAGAQAGVQAHDRFNMVRLSLTIKGK
jgi:hypothetical protein